MTSICIALLLLVSAAVGEAANVARLGAESPVSSETYRAAAGSRGSGGLVFGGNQYLAVWTDSRSGSPDVYAARVTRDNEVIDPFGIRIGAGINPDVAWSESAQAYLIAWTTSDSQSVLTRWIDRNGKVFGEQKSFRNPRPTNYPAVRLISNGRDFLLALEGGQPVLVVIQALEGGQPPVVGMLAPNGDFKQWMTPESLFGIKYQPAIATDGRDFAVVGYTPLTGQQIFLRIDPSTGQALSVHAAFASGVASNAGWTGDSYLITSQDQAFHIIGVFADREGNLISDSFIINGIPLTRGPGALASAGDGTAIEVWCSSVDWAAMNVYAARVMRSRTEASFAISATSDPELNPTVAWGGSNFLVMYQRMPNYSYGIYDSELLTAPMDEVGGVGAKKLLTQSAPKQREVTAARLGSSNLAVWEEESADLVPHLVSNRISDDGKLLDAAGRTLIASAQPVRLPALASSGDQALLVWLQQAGTSYQVSASRVDSSGALIDTTPIVISRQVLPLSSPFDTKPSAPIVAWTGDSYLVVWSDDFALLRLARISRDGVILNPGAGRLVEIAHAPQLHPTIVMGATSALIVWQFGVIPGLPCTYPCPRSPDAQIYAARVTAKGELLDADPFRVSPATAPEFRPALAWNDRYFLVAWASVTQNQVATARVSEESGTVSSFVELAQAENRPYEVGLGWDGGTWLATWNDGQSVKGTLIDSSGFPDGSPFTVSEATPESPASVVSTGRSLFALYQRLTPESTNVPRIFFRSVSAGPGRARAVRR